jgi:hypothetical protein
MAQSRAKVLATASRPSGTRPPLRPQNTGKSTTHSDNDIDAQNRRDFVIG